MIVDKRRISPGGGRLWFSKRKSPPLISARIASCPMQPQLHLSSSSCSSPRKAPASFRWKPRRRPASAALFCRLSVSPSAVLPEDASLSKFSFAHWRVLNTPKRGPSALPSLRGAPDFFASTFWAFSTSPAEMKGHLASKRGTHSLFPLHFTPL